MKDLTNLKTDFRDWITLPLTKTFIQLLEAEKAKLYKGANQYTYVNYHKKELDPTAVTAYGKVDGISAVLSILKACQEEGPETILDEKGVTIKDEDGKEILTYPTIDALFEQAFTTKEKEND